MHVRVYGEYVHFECTVLEAVEDGNKNFGHLSKLRFLHIEVELGLNSLLWQRYTKPLEVV